MPCIRTIGNLQSANNPLATDRIKNEEKNMKTIKEKKLQLVSFGQAARLQDFGFEWQTTYSYFFRETGWVVEKGYKIRSKIVFKGCEREYVSIPVPTVALALKWFNYTRHIVGFVFPGIKIYKYMYQNCLEIKMEKHRLEYNCIDRTSKPIIMSKKTFNNYEAAESALLDELLTILGNSLEECRKKLREQEQEGEQ
jgi:hypothetical protein